MRRLLALSAQMSFALALVAIPARGATTTIVSNVAALSATVGITNGDLAFAPGYNMADDRGGGWFIWTNGSAGITSDGGRWIVSSGGYWTRILKGEPANVKMWGAVGNNSADDTASIQAAVNACTTPLTIGQPWTQELLIPPGRYVLSNTIYFPSGLHIRGESVDSSIITMNRDTNILCTLNARDALNGTFDNAYDAHILIENLYLIFGPTPATNGAGILVYQPAENAIIRNVSIGFGGYGIRAFGNTPPGLKVYNAYFDGNYQANISIEGYYNGHYIGGGGPVTLSSVSGDHIRDDSNATARFVDINRCYPNVTITDLKAEGQYGGGLVRYILSNDAASTDVGCLRLLSATYDCYTNGSSSTVPCDVIVLGSDGARTADVLLDHVELSGPPGPRYLINDSLANRVEYPSGGYTQARLPIQYESEIPFSFLPPFSRYVVGGNAIVRFSPPQTNAWYRVMMWHGHPHQGATLVTHTWAESSELSVDVAGGNAPSAINVIRSSLNVPTWDTERPRITQARAGSYYCTNDSGYIGFVDLFVASWPYTNEVGVIAEPLDGLNEMSGFYDGQTGLFPPYVVTNLPSGLVDCVTTNLIR